MKRNKAANDIRNIQIHHNHYHLCLQHHNILKFQKHGLNKFPYCKVAVEEKKKNHHITSERDVAKEQKGKKQELNLSNKTRNL